MASKYFLSIALILFSTSAQSAEFLTLTFLEHFTPFEAPQWPMAAPMGGRVHVQTFSPASNPAPSFEFSSQTGAISKDPQLQKFFEEKFVAFLPPGQKIVVQKEAWNFPVGAAFGHFIAWKKESSANAYLPLEFRMVEKINNTDWEFSSYQPKYENQKLMGFVREVYDGIPVFASERERSGARDKLQMTHIRLSSCQTCHLMNSPHYLKIKEHLRQLPNEERVKEFKRILPQIGPCGFGPANTANIKKWAENFEKRFGYYPITVQSR